MRSKKLMMRMLRRRSRSHCVIKETKDSSSLVEEAVADAAEAEAVDEPPIPRQVPVEAVKQPLEAIRLQRALRVAAEAVRHQAGRPVVVHHLLDPIGDIKTS